MYCVQSGSCGFNLNQEEDEEIDEVQHFSTYEGSEINLSYTEHQQQELAAGDNEEGVYNYRAPMFEKTLTPSDVGKLNRLVIPKQHAETYFPLGGCSGGDSGEKGLLLGFEDESGKPWKFRYSYWNSSQSYVLTKGWSRFVKEKKLDAGDIVKFERHRVDGDRLFIGWRRRGTTAAVVAPPGEVTANGGGGGGWTRTAFYSEQQQPYPSQPNGPSVPYQPHCLHAGSNVHNQQGIGNSKRSLRLFGVNLEYQPDNDSDQTKPTAVHNNNGASAFSSSQLDQAIYHNYHYYSYHHATNASSSSSLQSHLELNFPRDVNQMRYHHQG